MSVNLNGNDLNGFENYLKQAFDQFEPPAPKGAWGKLHVKLFRKDVLDFVSFRKLRRSFNPGQQVPAVQIKTWISYAAAACLTVGVVFGASYLAAYDPQGQNTPIDAPNLLADFEEPYNVTADSKRPATGIPNVLPKNPVSPDNTQPEPFNHQNINYNQNQELNISPEQNLAEKQNDKAPDRSNKDKDNPQDNPQPNPNDKGNENPEDQNTDPQVADAGDQNNKDVQQEDLAMDLVFPNVFTPNGDGINDQFVIANVDKYPGNTLQISDRSGKLVYSCSNYQNDWEARNLPDGTYYYHFSYKDKSNKMNVRPGVIQVLR